MPNTITNGILMSYAILYMTGMAFLSLVLPAITLTSRAILSLPCIKSRVRKIRRGWERGVGDARN